MKNILMASFAAGALVLLAACGGSKKDVIEDNVSEVIEAPAVVTEDVVEAILPADDNSSDEK